MQRRFSERCRRRQQTRSSLGPNLSSLLSAWGSGSPSTPSSVPATTSCYCSQPSLLSCLLGSDTIPRICFLLRWGSWISWNGGDCCGQSEENVRVRRQPFVRERERERGEDKKESNEDKPWVLQRKKISNGGKAISKVNCQIYTTILTCYPLPVRPKMISSQPSSSQIFPNIC